MSAAAAAVAQAIKASGAIVRGEPEDFLRILSRQQEPLVVQATGGFFSTSYQYLSSYKGLAFYTKSSFPLTLLPLERGRRWPTGRMRGLLRNARCTKKPSHRNPLPQVVCDRTALSYDAKTRKRLGGEGTKSANRTMSAQLQSQWSRDVTCPRQNENAF